MPYLSDYAVQWILIIAASLVGIWASFGVKAAYRKYSSYPARSGLTGAQAAQNILNNNGIYDVKVVCYNGGELSDHFDPRAKTIRLSPAVYNSSSVSSICIAAHEVGHAIQYAKGYAPIKVRNAILPIANIGSQLSFPLVIIGILFGGNDLLINIGIGLFLAVLLFQLLTLPVEFNASRRAMENIDGVYVSGEETTGAKKVLKAAAMTYVAGVIASVFTLLRLLALSKRRD